jgi:hypothetical protein
MQTSPCNSELQELSIREQMFLDNFSRYDKWLSSVVGGFGKKSRTNRWNLPFEAKSRPAIPLFEFIPFGRSAASSNEFEDAYSLKRKS